MERDIKRWHHPDKGIYLFVATTSEQEIVTACGGFYRKDAQTCRVGHFSVDSKYRGLGMARLVMKQIIAKAKELDYNFIYLTTSSAQVPAFTLYKSIGFVFQGFTYSYIRGSSFHGLKQMQFILDL